MNIPRGRIEFYGHQQYTEYLNFYSQIDFILDTLPFTGGTTTCEALWMGVPVLTTEGLSPASKQSAAILRSLNEDRWIITNEIYLLNLMKNIENNPSILFDFKKNIRQKFNTSSIGNSSIFAKNFHNSLISMWNTKFPMP
jgi:predicted O-linked N-acetylglucosamine transferase (SPINDLY family)